MLVEVDFWRDFHGGAVAGQVVRLKCFRPGILCVIDVDRRLVFGADGGLTEIIALHAHFAGAAGTLVLGVMGRASRGHSGVSLSATRTMALSYLIVSGGAVLRIIGPIFFPQDYLTVTAAAAADKP